MDKQLFIRWNLLPENIDSANDTLIEIGYFNTSGK